MIGRRALLSVAAATGAAGPAGAQAGRGRGFYGGGTKQRTVAFAGSAGVTLGGTLLLPIISELQRVPGVVLVAGSGPTDRNGNNPLAPERIDVLKLLAEALVQAGIASLRYDKRGIGSSTPLPRGTLAEQERFISFDNFVDDVVAAQTELVRHDEIKPYATALLGHSEGGLLALAALPRIARHRPHALVLAATPGRPFGDVLRGQISRSAPALLETFERAMAAIRSTGHVPAGLPRELETLFPLYAGPYLQALTAFDPAAALRALDRPCLVLQGGADRQVVPMEDVQPLIDALGQRPVPGEAVILPSVSHNLKLVTWPTDLGFGGPIASSVVARLRDWLGPALGA